MQITKRDGRIVSFDQDKITNAITKAFISTGVEITPSIKARITKLSNKVTSELMEDQTYSVDDIQNRVEKVLMKSSFPDQAKEYVIYRKHRDELRDSNKYLNKLFNELVSVNAADVDIKRENANINGDTSMAIMLRMGSEANKEFSKKYMMKPEYAYLHDKGIFHEHDQDFYNITFNCCQIPAGKLLKNGFDTGHGFIRTPNSIRTAAALMCIIIQSNQNEMFGGQSVPTFEYDLAPYVVKSFYKHFKDVFEYQFEDYSAEEAIKLAKLIYHENGTLLGYKQLDKFITAVDRVYDLNQYDLNRVLDQAIKLTEDETYQACEAIIHNLNSMHCIPADQKVVILNLDKSVYTRDMSEIEQNALKKLLSELYTKMTISEIAAELNSTKKIITKLLHKFGIHIRDKSETAKFMEHKYLERYGVINPSCLPEVKEKVKKAQFEKYGCYAWNTEKYHETCLKKYGVRNPSQSPIVKEKMKKTCMEHYGVPYVFQSKEFKEASKKTCLEKYGMYPYPPYPPRVNKSNGEIKIVNFIHENFPDLKIEENVRGIMSEIPTKEIDIWIPEIRLGIEYNGIHWHNKKAYFDDIENGTSTTRERIKDMCAVTNNFKLLQIWEDDYTNNTKLMNTQIFNAISEELYDDE